MPTIAPPQRRTGNGTDVPASSNNDEEIKMRVTLLYKEGDDVSYMCDHEESDQLDSPCVVLDRINGVYFISGVNRTSIGHTVDGEKYIQGTVDFEHIEVQTRGLITYTFGDNPTHTFSSAYLDMYYNAMDLLSDLSERLDHEEFDGVDIVHAFSAIAETALFPLYQEFARVFQHVERAGRMLNEEDVPTSDQDRWPHNSIELLCGPLDEWAS